MITPLARILDRFEKEAGPAPAPPAKDPLGLILWENVAYLVDDERRAKAFQDLKRRVGLAAARILEAPEEVLLDVARLGGMMPALRVGKLRAVAATAIEVAGGDLRKVLGLPPKEARKVLKKFPGIGEPGAEKILLFTGTEPVLALDSNALRVLQRLGYGSPDRNYAKAYRSARDAAAAELPARCDALTRATLLLRRHGQTLCKNAAPLCAACPAARDCAFARNEGSGD